VLKRDLPVGEPKRAVLDEVLSQVERMDKAVRNLLSFARPPEPKMTMVDVNELIGKLLDFLSPQFAKSGIIAERKLLAGLPWLVLDPDLMQQALLNISLNAVKAMPQGGKITFETRMEMPEAGGSGSIVIMISDSGEGIAPENLSRIFSPFFTTRQQGTGLGLSITQRIVEQHNGEISVQSAAGKGAVFTISLPFDPKAIEARSS
jgi:signal transduction histidine kinase